jgi:Membrane protein involved in colicin uptake
MRTIPSLRNLLFALALLVVSVPSFAQMRISVSFGPPALPIYDQPLCPGEGYIWTPGYWAWDEDDYDYYWVPGTWVLAPEVGFLWTPPYWAWVDDAYVFYDGYWGPHVGFYGGIVYGFGYTGFGYEGGRWEGDRFFYNRSVTNVNVVNVRNVYNETVVNNNVTVNRVSYNGGPGGVHARPRPQEEIATRERHLPPVGVQTRHFQEARSDRELHASANHGRPPVAATPRPALFHDRAAVPARQAGAPYNPPANRRAAARPREGNRPAGAVHPNDLPPLQRPAPRESANSGRDRKYQQQQDKLFAKQEKERQKLQQKQEQEHQRMGRQNADQGRKQQVEQRHQQQTQQLEQRHAQQQQRIQQRQQPPPKR